MRHSLANSARVQEEQTGQNSCDFCEICRLLETLLGLFSFQVYNFVKFVLLATLAIFASECLKTFLWISLLKLRKQFASKILLTRSILHATCYLLKKPNFFSSIEFQKNGRVLLFKTLFRYWNPLFPVVCYNRWQGWTSWIWANLVFQVFFKQIDHNFPWSTLL